MMYGVIAYPNTMSKITTIEMTGIVLKIEMYGLSTHDTLFLNPAKDPSIIPKIADDKTDTSKRTRDSPMIAKELPSLANLPIVKRTSRGEGKIKR